MYHIASFDEEDTEGVADSIEQMQDSFLEATETSL
jgi:hypothetical protein